MAGVLVDRNGGDDFDLVVFDVQFLTLGRNCEVIKRVLDPENY
jgi:hypothetical protein